MHHLNSERQPCRVMAIFEASMLSFALPPTATVGDLAERLADFGCTDDGILISVDVVDVRVRVLAGITAGGRSCARSTG